MAHQALGKNYFQDTGYPLTVKKVDAATGESHGFDLTEQKHFHDFSELVVVTKGSGIHWLEGTEYNVTAGDVFLVQGDQLHYFSERKNLVLYNIMFRPEALPLPMKELRKIPGYHAIFILEPAYRKRHEFESHLSLSRTSLARVESMARNMLREIKSKKEGFEAVLISDLIGLFIYLSRQYSKFPNNSRGRHIRRVAEIIGRLEQEYDAPWKLADIASQAGMSEGNLNRVFKEATDHSPIDYLIQLRLQGAMELLSDTAFTVTEIAFEVGFNDSNYFTRIFKKMVGNTPSEYRLRQKNLKAGSNQVS